MTRKESPFSRRLRLLAVAATLLGLPSLGSAFQVHHAMTTRKTRTSLFTSNMEEEETNSDIMSEAERMKAVRNLQKSFYTSPSVTAGIPPPQLDPDTGIMTDLPLWRVGWTEVPGRTNCLNVHEGEYTHMFETILRRSTETGHAGPLYFGQLYLPGGSTTARLGERRFQLKSWREEIAAQQEMDHAPGGTRTSSALPMLRSAVVGTLMQITDYRRLQDGRLCLLVQVVERFVVDKVVQEFPYAVANVQLLPDEEELLLQGGDIGRAVQRAFQYHPYEFYNKTELPILKNDDEYTSVKAINVRAISKLLPFAMYSLDESLLNGITETMEEELEETTTSGDEDDRPSLHALLEVGGILQTPPMLSGDEDDDYEDEMTNLDELETQLWYAIEDLVHKRADFELPPEILALLPPHLEDHLDLTPQQQQSSTEYYDDAMQMWSFGEPNIRLSAKYPAYRRQKRLSYALPGVLEGSKRPEGGRQVLLHTPSTKARLQLFLERLQHILANLEEEEHGWS